MESIKNILKEAEMEFTLWVVEAVEKEFTDLLEADEEILSDFEKLLLLSIIALGLPCILSVAFLASSILDLSKNLQKKEKINGISKESSEKE